MAVSIGNRHRGLGCAYRPGSRHDRRLRLPFSIPKSLIDDRSWKAFALRFPTRFADPDAFRHWAMDRAEDREIRRACDRDAKTPFNSYNLRIYRQTWWGIAHLLSPLIRSGRAVVRPYQPLPTKPHPIIIEACPACAMKGIDFYPPYKGHTEKHRLERKATLGKLIDRGLLEPPAPSIRARLIDNTGGDALDAVIAAITTAHARSRSNFVRIGESKARSTRHSACRLARKLLTGAIWGLYRRIMSQERVVSVEALNHLQRTWGAPGDERQAQRAG